MPKLKQMRKTRLRKRSLRSKAKKGSCSGHHDRPYLRDNHCAVLFYVIPKVMVPSFGFTLDEFNTKLEKTDILSVCIPSTPPASV